MAVLKSDILCFPEDFFYGCPEADNFMAVLKTYKFITFLKIFFMAVLKTYFHGFPKTHIFMAIKEVYFMAVIKKYIFIGVL